MIKTILFDLDGLLVETEIISFKIYQELYSKINKPFTLDNYLECYSGKQLKTNVNFFLNSNNLDWNYNQTVEEINVIEKRLFNEGVALKPGVRELLTFLKENDYRIILATSSLKERGESLLKKHQIISYFDEFVWKEDIEFGKPYPDVYLKAAQLTNTPKENCLVLEDSANGIEAAYRAGIKVICIPDLKLPEKEYTDKCFKILNSLFEVIDLLKNEGDYH